MTEFGYFVLDDAQAEGSMGNPADPIPTFEYPGEADIPASAEVRIMLTPVNLAARLLALIIAAETTTDREDEVVKLTTDTIPIRIYPAPAGVDCYNVTKGKGKRGSRKMAGKLGGERW